jgi:hypothetical protein
MKNGQRRGERLNRFLTALDRGEIVTGRIVQQPEPGIVRVALGGGTFWARAVGGEAPVRRCRFEVVVPGRRPVLRLISGQEMHRLDLWVDPSAEKARPTAGMGFDGRA